MAEQLLDTVRDALEGPIDFEGQRLAEEVTTAMLILTGLVSFLVGFGFENMQYALWSGLGGTVLVFFAVVPPWPYFNKHPVKWLPAAGTGLEGLNISVG